MSLHSGIDTCAFVSFGLFTKNYGSTAQANINNLFASLGLLEDAPEPSEVVAGGYAYALTNWGYGLWKRIRRSRRRR